MSWGEVRSILPEAYVIDPECRLARRLVDHRCTDNQGAPIRPHQSCYYEARLQLLADIEAKAVDEAIASLGNSVSTLAALPSGATAPTVGGASHVRGAVRPEVGAAPLTHVLSQPATANPAVLGHLRPAELPASGVNVGGPSRPEGDPPAGGDVCDQCGGLGRDVVGISHGAQELGFCTLAHAACWVRTNWLSEHPHHKRVLTQ